jgi:hypothetical protein
MDLQLEIWIDSFIAGMTTIGTNFMKNLKGFLLFSFLLLGIAYYSCDDSGVTPPFHNTGIINLTAVNLKPLNQSVDGIYELWMYFDSAAPSWENVGRFNVTGSGEIISESGGSMSFSLGADTNRMSHLTVCLVSIEGPGTNNSSPGSSRLIATGISSSNFYADSISASLKMSDSNALGLPGSIMNADTGRGFFYVVSPSTNNSNCSQGIWLCDISGNNGNFPHGLDLDPNGGWVYKMWVINNLTVSYSFCGSFSSFYGPDNDSAGPCRGPIDTFYNAPGEDFIQSGVGCTSIPDMNDLNHGVFVTLEPKSRTNNTQPFFITIYIQSRISGGCADLHQIPKQISNLLPYARIRISMAR